MVIKGGYCIGGQPSSRHQRETNVPAGTLALVRSPQALRCSKEQNALHTLIHQRHLTPSCGGRAPTAERTLNPARMFTESLTPGPELENSQGHERRFKRKSRISAFPPIPDISLRRTAWRAISLTRDEARRMAASIAKAASRGAPETTSGLLWPGAGHPTAGRSAGDVTNCAMCSYIGNASAPLPAALDRRGNRRLLHRPRRQLAGARLRGTFIWGSFAPR